MDREQFDHVNLKKDRRIHDHKDLQITKNKRFEKKYFFVCFWQFPPLFIPKEWIAPIDHHYSIFFKDWRDRFILVDLWKRSTISESIPLIFQKDWREWFNFFHDRSDLSIRKTSDSIEKPMIEFPTLVSGLLELFWGVEPRFFNKVVLLLKVLSF